MFDNYFVYLCIVILCKNFLYDKTVTNGSIASCRIVMNVFTFYCLQTPEGGPKVPKLVAQKYFNKLNWFIDNFILSVI
jgi:hypothetical protein